MNKEIVIIDKTRICELDESFFKIINLLDKFNNRLFFEYSSLIDSIELLKKYIHEHMQIEEKYMHFYNYSDITFHQTLHRVFEKEINHIHDDFIENGNFTKFKLKIIDFVQSWHFHHISHEDVKFIQFMKSISIPTKLVFESIN
ncbi:MAG: hemerythrin family protein [bacterium]